MKLKYTASPVLKGGLLLIFLFVTGLFYTNAQIISTENEPEKEEKKKSKKEKNDVFSTDSLTGTTYYLTGMMNYGYRAFRDESVFGSYADWEEQTADYSGGMSIGVIFPVQGKFSVDLGFSFFGQKEQYNFSDSLTDSTYHFSNTYMQMGIPVKLRYTIGDRFQFFGFAGFTPVNVLSIRFNESFTRADGTSVESEVEVQKEKLAMFNLMTNVGFGISYNFRNFGFTLYPEYRQYLLNTFDPQKPLFHRMYGLGVHAGLTLLF